MHEADRLFQQGFALLDQGRLGQAREAFDKVVKLNNRHFDAFNLLGIISVQSKNPQLAISFFDKAIKLNRDNPYFYCNRGNAYYETNQIETALINYNRAISIDPYYAEAYSYKGIALIAKNLLTEALENIDKAIEIKPEYAEGFINRGIVLTALNELEEAVHSYDKAIELIPGYALAHTNRGNVLHDLNRLEESIISHCNAININPNYAEAYYNKGNSLKDLFRLIESIESFDKAIDINPEYAQAYWNKSIVLLSLRDFVNGWQLYDWRWKNKSLGLTAFYTSKPKLKNFVLNENKKLLIWGEQGVGDQVLYASMFDQLLRIAPLSQITLDKRLFPLLKRSLPQGVFLDISKDIEDSKYDEHLPMGDLGKYFRTSSKDFDISRKHYLTADPHRASEIRSNLIAGKKFLCGITWTSKAERIGAQKSIQLEDLLPLLSLKDIAFVSLQYGNIHKQLAEFNEKHNMNILECDSVDNFNDLDGHAALIEACDFVITISNTSAHMAGAIGKETYLMCPSGKGLLWYWSNQTNGKCLWYPSIHIYEQNLPGQWFDVVQSVKLVIKKKINEIE